MPIVRVALPLYLPRWLYDPLRGVKRAYLDRRKRPLSLGDHRGKTSLGAGSVDVQGKFIKLKVRKFEEANDPERFSTEKDGRYVYQWKEMPLSQLALILMDVWADHPNDGWRARQNANISAALLPLVQGARRQHVLVVHSPNGLEIDGRVKPLPDEVVVDGPDQQAQLLRLLRQKDIRYLLYAGYASNMCVLTRPTGISKMAASGFQIYFVRDASLAIEAPEFVENEMSHKVATYMVELNWGATTTVEDVLDALEGR